MLIMHLNDWCKYNWTHHDSPLHVEEKGNILGPSRIRPIYENVMQNTIRHLFISFVFEMKTNFGSGEVKDLQSKLCVKLHRETPKRKLIGFTNPMTQPEQGWG